MIVMDMDMDIEQWSYADIPLSLSLFFALLCFALGSIGASLVALRLWL